MIGLQLINNNNYPCKRHLYCNDKVVQVTGRHPKGAFLFMDFFRKYLKYNTADYIIMCV